MSSGEAPLLDALGSLRGLVHRVTLTTAGHEQLLREMARAFENVGMDAPQRSSLPIEFYLEAQ